MVLRRSLSAGKESAQLSVFRNETETIRGKPICSTKMIGKCSVEYHVLVSTEHR